MSKRQLKTKQDLLHQLGIQINYLSNCTKRYCLLRGFKEVGYSYPRSIKIYKSELLNPKDSEYIKDYNDYDFSIELGELIPDYHNKIGNYINEQYESTKEQLESAKKSMIRFCKKAYKNIDELE